TDPEVVELFEKYNVLSKRELESRREIYCEQYRKAVGLEAKLMLEMGRTIVFPSAIRYQGQLAGTCANLKSIGFEFDASTLKQLNQLIARLEISLNQLETVIDHGHFSSSLDE